MWYAKHPFDCIVVGGLCGPRWLGAPHLGGVRQPDCRGLRGGGLFPHTAVFCYWGSVLSCSRADVRAEECVKTEHTGGPCSPSVNSPWAGIQSTCHTRTQPRPGGGNGRVGWEVGAVAEAEGVDSWIVGVREEKSRWEVRRLQTIFIR